MDSTIHPLADQSVDADDALLHDDGGHKPQELPPEPEPPKPGPEPDTAADDGEVTAARDEKGRFVPHQALHAEREEHKKTKQAQETLSRELQEAREFKARMEERMRWIEAANTQKAEAEPEGPPDPGSDIFAAISWTQQQLLAQQKQQEEARQATDAERAQQALWSHWDNDVASFAAQEPDYSNAAQWMYEFRNRQLEALSQINPQYADPNERIKAMRDELANLVVAAAQQNQSPAKMLYEYARSAGYAPTAPEPAAQNETLQLSDKLKGIDAAQRASRTVAAASGQSAGDPLTLDTIASMSEQEFTTWAANPANRAKFDQLMAA